jgi:cysteinyl-tRNA synthetase
MLFLYDTVSRKKVPLVPLRTDRVGVYTCGPTVYRYVHIGNLRTYLLTDLLLRAVRYSGRTPFSVQNITDMGHMHEEQLEQTEDKVIAAARAAGKTAKEIAEFFTEAFFRDCHKMNILPSDEYPRASTHVPEMIEVAKMLERKGATYGEGGYLYFDVTKAKGYGELSGAVLGEGEAAGRTDASIHLRKKRPEDFSLWLAAEPGREFSWESPWGLGWPGWHIECAAMAGKYLGPDFDIHVGGVDLRFPHHENSRAMAMTATGGRFACLWVHAAHLLVDGHKMSKSMKNEYTLDDLEVRGVSPMDFRYHCLTLHYRTPMNFTWAAQEASAKGLMRLREALAGKRVASGKSGDGREAQEYRRRFREAIEDDLNTPRALSVVYEAARSGLPGEVLRTLAEEWDEVLGVGLLAECSGKTVPKELLPEEIAPGEIVDLALLRDRCRRERKFAEADALREKIREAGYEVIDRKDEPGRLKKL